MSQENGEVVRLGNAASARPGGSEVVVRLDLGPRCCELPGAVLQPRDLGEHALLPLAGVHQLDGEAHLLRVGASPRELVVRR